MCFCDFLKSYHIRTNLLGKFFVKLFFVKIVKIYFVCYFFIRHNLRLIGRGESTFWGLSIIILNYEQ
jgi:hypothetical protein